MKSKHNREKTNISKELIIVLQTKVVQRCSALWTYPWPQVCCFKINRDYSLMGLRKSSHWIWIWGRTGKLQWNWLTTYRHHSCRDRKLTKKGEIFYNSNIKWMWKTTKGKPIKTTNFWVIILQFLLTLYSLKKTI